VAVRNLADQPLAAQATAAHPHHFRIGGGLIKKHQVSWVKPNLNSKMAIVSAST
jgi:hypothetical protein